MRKSEMKLIHSERIAKDTFELILEDDYITQEAVPGQFIYISVPNFTLRRPISIADVDREKKQLTILFKVVGKGTAELAELEPGILLDCLGPNGNGFPLDMENGGHALLIGGGIGVPPLYYLGKELKQKGMEVTSIIGFQNAEYVFYEERFSALGDTYVVTDDGSYGNEGFVTDVLDDITAFDTYFSCGPKGMLLNVTKKLSHKNGYISLEERMGCGVGACAACVVRTNTEAGYKKICSDGPVFPAKEVIL